jgi:hypothetical protein
MCQGASPLDRTSERWPDLPWLLGERLPLMGPAVGGLGYGIVVRSVWMLLAVGLYTIVYDPIYTVLMAGAEALATRIRRWGDARSQGKRAKPLNRNPP